MKERVIRKKSMLRREADILVKSKISKIASLVMALLIVVAITPQIGPKAHAATTGKIGGPNVLKSGVNTADAKLVKMGDRYWYVIGYDGTGIAAGSGEISFLSKDNIKLAPFDKNYDIVYNSSNLKKEIESYINENFSAGEKSAIAARDLSAVTIKENENVNWWENNYQTVDSVVNVAVNGALLWPLSAKEAVALNASIRKTGVEYWLRSLGVPEDEEYVWYGLEEFDVYTILPGMAIVTADGKVEIQDDNTSYWKGIRPAFKLNKSDIVMVSEATGSKDSAEDGTLAEAGAVTAKNLKLTVKDNAHKNFYVNPCDVDGAGGSLTVKYRNASTGENEYISAVIKGADGSIKQYGRLAKAAADSGTATIKGLPTDSSGKISLPEGDKLYVFNEQYNGDEKTDYVSNLREISLTGHNWVFDDLKWDSQTGDVEASYHCSIDGNHFTTAKGEYEIEDIAPTCEEKGKQMQILSISAEKSPDGKAHSKSTKLADEGEPLGHNYKAFLGFRWTGNASAGYSNAEAIFGCTRDYSHKTYVEADVTPTVQEPTCTAIGRTLYEANLSADKSPDGMNHGEAKYAKARPRLGHDWGDPTYEWSADNKTVTATRVCNRDKNHVETETVETEITNVRTAPTCKAEGVGDVKTKPFTNEAFEEAFKEKTKTGVKIPIDPDAHAWDDGEQQGDPNSCGGYTTLFKCKIYGCGCEKTELTGGDAHKWSTDYKVFDEPTCTEEGVSFKECENCHVFYLEGPQLIDPIGHKWEFTGFTWTGNETDGYEKAIANYVCEHDQSHTMTANAVISEKVIEPTCTAGGKTVYTASISAADSPDETAHSESIDAKETATVPHEWKYTGSMVWTGNDTDGYTKADARYKCKYGCGETAEVEAKITEKEQPATCEKPGGTLYTAKVDEASRLTDEEVKDETKLVKDTEPLGHDWDFRDMIWTGDEKNGFTKAQAKYVCERDNSHEKLVDAKITEEVVKPNCVEEGFTLYIAEIGSEESLDGEEYSDVNVAKIKDATGHAWKLKGFTWTEDKERGYKAKANYVCGHDVSHAESLAANIRVTKKAATCEEPGGTLYTAIVGKDKSLTNAEVKDEKFVKETNPTGHKWDKGKVTKKATTKATGIKTYTCTVCKATKTEIIPKIKPVKSTVKPVLVAKAIANGKTAGTISWNKIKDADRYVIYLSSCNYKGKHYTAKKVKTVNAKTFKWKKTKLKKNRSYKFYVIAQKKSGKTYKKIAKSKMGYFYTGNVMGKYTNAKSLKLKKSAITIKKGKSWTIKATVTKAKKNKKFSTNHTTLLRYTSNNPTVATVNAKGKVTAKKAGTATIYVQTINGIWKTCKVTVK